MNEIDIKHTCSFTGHRPERLEMRENRVLTWLEEQMGRPGLRNEDRMRGIFWIIDDALTAFVFKEGAEHGVAKSGVTFNHKAYWNWAKPAHCKKGFDYYPRGRVDYTNQGRPIIFMNPNIDEVFVSEIIEVFRLEEKPIIKYDCSEHYKCYLDR